MSPDLMAERHSSTAVVSQRALRADAVSTGSHLVLDEPSDLLLNQFNGSSVVEASSN